MAGQTEQTRARTLAIQSFANRVVRGLLCIPLISRLVGARLLTIYATGRKSGRRYSVPVAYLRHDDALLVGTPFGWGRNLRTGEPVPIRFRGRRVLADVEVITDEAGVVDCYAIMARHNRQFAKFNRIALDEHGEPDAQDLRQCWAAGARAFRLRPMAPAHT
jgi:deazaflavin-dependent oxidoreductase (nitroreductase family)